MAAIAASIVSVYPVQSARAQDLEGDVRLACEALLCLSSGERPDECTPSLQRYFSIKFKMWKDTLKGRINFLKLCPVAGNDGNDSNMASLVQAIGEGAGQCTAEELNKILQTVQVVYDCTESGAQHDVGNVCTPREIIVIGNELPGYCQVYSSHSYTYGLGVRYIGEPLNGGYWANEN